MDTLVTNITKYVESHIGEFHADRISKLQSLNLDTLLKKKNPYLFKAKDMATPEQIVRSFASAFMSSAEESMFGEWLEKLAIYIAETMHQGKKSGAEGIDLEMDKDGTHYFISIKSGPNWCNSSSLAKLRQNFQKAQRIYHTSGNHTPCEAIEGCCYGNMTSRASDSHTRLCGESFWQFISGHASLYTDIIEPLGTDAHRQNVLYSKEYNRMITKFTKEFSSRYCDEDGNILWRKIIQLNSGKKKQHHP